MNSRDADFFNSDNTGYWQYTGSQRVKKAMVTLDGIIAGLEIDGAITEPEFRILREWMGQQEDVSHREPFREACSLLEEAMLDRRMTADEVADVRWLCGRFSPENAFFDNLTQDMQRLHGVIGTISADGKITEAELRSLRDWLDQREHLRTCWPYDEINSLVVGVLRDSKITQEEHDMLIACFQEFIRDSSHKAITVPLDESLTPIRGLCAVCPEIEFPARLFCFTGKCTRGSRRELCRLVEARGGETTNRVVNDLDYLVIGAEGNAAWAYACYGRKVEEAVSLRKSGARVVLVHELDFWDSV